LAVKFLIAFVAVGLSFAPAAPAQASDRLKAHEKQAVIDELGKALGETYVFPDKVPTLVATLKAKAEKGGYEAVQNDRDFAAAVTKDLVDASGDMHFQLGADPQWVAEFRANDGKPGSVSAQETEFETATNYGFRTVEMLDGNIGYIRLDHFADPQTGYDTATSAMRFVQHADGIIFDLRYNNGGTLEMAQLLASYLFASGQDRLLFQYYYNERGARVERGQWVLAGLPGKRVPEVPVYVLTGSSSFSAAEWFAYALQKLGRATLVGQTTAGGAHPVTRVPLDDTFFLQVPFGQIRDPVDGGDFEGTGVVPDRAVPSIDALDVAHREMLERLAKTKAHADAAWFLPAIDARLDHAAPDPAVLASAQGHYEGRDLVLENGRLFYRWRGRFSLALEPLRNDLFAAEGADDYRIHLVSKDGRVVAMERVFRDGTVLRYVRLD
jgi:hypothetical protein